MEAPDPGAAGGAEARARASTLRRAAGASPVVWIAGADARGALFGAGRLLRELDWSQGDLWLGAPGDIATAPAYPIRGHQLGYRAQANSYDAWDAAHFERYIRELTFFGVNSIEGIPFQDTRPTPVMKAGRREMNKAIGEICHRYGWTTGSGCRPSSISMTQPSARNCSTNAKSCSGTAR